MHTNDTHGYVEHEPYLSSLIKQKKLNGENVLTISAGDVFHGQLISTMSKGQSILNVMNATGYDYLAPGNHDFNYGVDTLQKLVAQGKFKTLCANVSDHGKFLFEPYEIKEVDGIKIGLFGLTTPETLEKSSAKSVGNLTFDEPIEVAKKIVKELQAQKVDMIVAITHLGLDKSSLDKNRSDVLAKEVPQIDLIIDGHSHTVLKDGLAIENTLVVQTGEYGKNIGEVDVVFDDNKLKSKTAKLFETDKINLLPDEAVSTIIKQELNKIEKLSNEKVCKINFDLDGEREQVRKRETNLSNLITDAFIAATNADVAIINGGGIRASIKHGTITRRDILNVLPFSNIVVTEKVKGSDIIKALQHGTEHYDESFGGFAQTSGITFKLNPNAKEVFDIKFTKTGEQLDPDSEYTLATNDFINQGGDGYSMLKKNALAEYGTMDEVVMDYMKHNNLEQYAHAQNRMIISKETSKGNLITESYKVQPKDSLYRIAMKFNTTWQKLAKLNKISSPYLIFPGDLIKLQ